MRNCSISRYSLFTKVKSMADVRIVFVKQINEVVSSRNESVRTKTFWSPIIKALSVARLSDLDRYLKSTEKHKQRLRDS